MLKYFVPLYSPKYISALIYLLQKSGYKPAEYLKAINKTKDFSVYCNHKYAKRRLNSALHMILAVIALIDLLAAIYLLAMGIRGKIAGGIFFGVALYIIYPFILSYLLALLIKLFSWYKYAE